MEMYFDGAYSKEGVGAGVVLISPKKEEIHLSYKLEFEATNNVVEYEALILGLEAARKMQITELVVFGDFRTCGSTNQRLSDKASQDESIQKSGMGFN
jgi:ribonuclease HI